MLSPAAPSPRSAGRCAARRPQRRSWTLCGRWQWPRQRRPRRRRRASDTSPTARPQARPSPARTMKNISPRRASSRPGHHGAQHACARRLSAPVRRVPVGLPLPQGPWRGYPSAPAPQRAPGGDEKGQHDKAGGGKEPIRISIRGLRGQGNVSRRACPREQAQKHHQPHRGSGKRSRSGERLRFVPRLLRAVRAPPCQQRTGKLQRFCAEHHPADKREKPRRAHGDGEILPYTQKSEGKDAADIPQRPFRPGRHMFISAPFRAGARPPLPPRAARRASLRARCPRRPTSAAPIPRA